MKKVLLGFILGAITATSVTVIATTQDMFTAQRATFTVEVGGEEFKSENPPLVVGGRTYLALRDTGEALGVPVEWNETERKVEIGGNVESTAEPKTEPTATPVLESTAEPTQTNIPNPTPEVVKPMKSLGLFKIRSESLDSMLEDMESIYEYKGEIYLSRRAFGSYGSYNGTELSIKLPGQESKCIIENKRIVPEYAHQDLRVSSDVVVKLSAFNLKARLDHETSTCWIEWIEEP